MRFAKLTLWVVLLMGAVWLNAVQYNVVGEVFTQTWCGYCPDARAGLLALSQNQPDLFIPMIWEGDGSHPSPGYSERGSMYGVGGIPHAQFGGTNDQVGGGTNMLPYYTNEYNALISYDSPIEMTIAFGVNGDGDYVISANCEVVSALPSTTNNQIVFAITKRWTNEYFCTVNRYAYESFTLTGVGDTGMFTHVFDGDASWPLEDLKAVVMVQDWSGAVGDKQIIQARSSGNTTLTALFRSNIQSGPAQLGVQFTDNSIPQTDVVSWSWDLDGDGNEDSSLQNPYHLYTETGQYDVTLTVTDVNNETAELTMENYITVLDGSAVFGDVSGVWVSEHSPYNVIGDVAIPAGSQLIIAPGVQVNLSNEALFDITGGIIAGGDGEMTYFTGGPNHNEWSGLEIRFADQASTITNCSFEDAINSAIFIEDSDVEISDCIFTNNEAMSRGAGVHMVAVTDVAVNSSLFYGNESTNNSGAIGAENSILSLTGNLFVNNSASFASAIGLKQGSQADIVNCTIANNLNSGSTHADVALFQSGADIVNSIVRSGNTTPIYSFNGDPQVTYSNISGGYAGDGNIDADPMFNNPTEGDGVDFADIEASWVLTTGSTSIDAGNPDTMFNDIEDPNNTGMALFPSMGDLTADMGAFGGPTPCAFPSMVGVGGEEITPVVNELSAYPNPFNPTTTLAFNMVQSGQAEVKVYNTRGQLVRTLHNGQLEAGPHTLVWTGIDNDNQPVASGVYFARFTASGQVITQKMALLK